MSLFRKGAAFRAVKDGVTRYRMAKNIVQFHDACILWRAPRRSSSAHGRGWRTRISPAFEEPSRYHAGPSLMRVIPVNESVESRNEVLSRNASGSSRVRPSVAVVKCPCRAEPAELRRPRGELHPDQPGAEYVVDRGHGREITKRGGPGDHPSLPRGGLGPDDGEPPAVTPSSQLLFLLLRDVPSGGAHGRAMDPPRAATLRKWARCTRLRRSARRYARSRPFRLMKSPR